MGNWRKIAGRAFFGEEEKQIQSEGYSKKWWHLRTSWRKKIPCICNRNQVSSIPFWVEWKHASPSCEGQPGRTCQHLTLSSLFVQSHQHSRMIKVIRAPHRTHTPEDRKCRQTLPLLYVMVNNNFQVDGIYLYPVDTPRPSISMREF